MLLNESLNGHIKAIIFFHSFVLIIPAIIDAHRGCEGIDAHGLKIQGRGNLMFFAKIPRGVKAFRKNSLGGGGPPYFGFYCIFINKCFEICLRGVLYLPSPLPLPHPPPCVHLCVRGKGLKHSTPAGKLKKIVDKIPLKPKIGDPPGNFSPHPTPRYLAKFCLLLYNGFFLKLSQNFLDQFQDHKKTK